MFILPFGLKEIQRPSENFAAEWSMMRTKEE